MKKTILFIAATLTLHSAIAQTQEKSVEIDGRQITVKEENGRLKVRVYEEEEEKQLIFEGHYIGGKSYERRERAIYIPIPFRRWAFNPHWDGFSVGFAGLADEERENINDVEGAQLLSDLSLEYNLNLLEKHYRLGPTSNWAVVTGLGLRWSRYRADKKFYFLEKDNYTSLQPSPADKDVRASRLNITSLTIPLLMEWQNRHRLFFSLGIEGVVKTMSSSKLTWRDKRGKEHTDVMDKGMNLRPVSMDFLAQAGFCNIGAYARYSPLSLFESGRGVPAYPVALGLMLHF
ncbi:MAG: PorT family protein [Tannerellaceae bacterium]|jgi:hypothetical protein|nr:PorT family protein [Tannerellaceae bacterium]